MKNLSLLALVTLCVVACSSTTYVKQGASEQDLSRDRYSCLKEAQIDHMGNYKMNSEGAFSSQHYNVDDRLFALCMSDKGWTKK
jgi:hypothetical protein